jgi:hypothetical protein
MWKTQVLFMKGSSSMRTQHMTVESFVKRFESIAGKRLRQLAYLVAFVTVAYCQSQTVAAAGSPPQIVNFAASRSYGNVWVVSGTVIDDNLRSITVQLGGYLMDGTNVYPAVDGSFSYAFYVTPGDFAYISAIAYDSVENEYSQPAEVMIFGY